MGFMKTIEIHGCPYGYAEKIESEIRSFFQKETWYDDLRIIIYDSVVKNEKNKVHPLIRVISATGESATGKIIEKLKTVKTLKVEIECICSFQAFRIKN